MIYNGLQEDNSLSPSSSHEVFYVPKILHWRIFTLGRQSKKHNSPAKIEWQIQNVSKGVSALLHQRHFSPLSLYPFALSERSPHPAATTTQHLITHFLHAATILRWHFAAVTLRSIRDAALFLLGDMHIAELPFVMDYHRLL